MNNAGKCSPVSPLCKTYDEGNGHCTSCYPGYVPDKGTCLIGNAKDQNCKNFVGNQCDECYSGFYLNYEYKCMQANPICKTIDRNDGRCTSCYSGYVVKNATCVPGEEKDPNCKNFAP